MCDRHDVCGGIPVCRLVGIPVNYTRGFVGCLVVWLFGSLWFFDLFSLAALTWPTRCFSFVLSRALFYRKLVFREV